MCLFASRICSEAQNASPAQPRACQLPLCLFYDKCVTSFHFFQAQIPFPRWVVDKLRAATQCPLSPRNEDRERQRNNLNTILFLNHIITERKMKNKAFWAEELCQFKGSPRLQMQDALTKRPWNESAGLPVYQWISSPPLVAEKPTATLCVHFSSLSFHYSSFPLSKNVKLQSMFSLFLN